jgi:hypothetical protein
MISKTMIPNNDDLKKIVGRVKATQTQLQAILKDKTWVEEARRYAERQGKEVKKLLAADMGKVRIFLERERRELERFQRQIPGEVKKFRQFVDGQRKELEKLLVNVRNAGTAKPPRKRKKAPARRSQK